MSTWRDTGREAMRARHSVMNVYDIPPAAYYGKFPIAPCASRSANGGINRGTVCNLGLWDEAIDEPIAYPFVADDCGFCYIPDWKMEKPRQGFTPLTNFDPNKPELHTGPCTLACNWKSF